MSEVNIIVYSHGMNINTLTKDQIKNLIECLLKINDGVNGGDIELDCCVEELC